MSDTQHDKIVTIPLWFAEKNYKSANDVMEYLFNQYYIYSKERQYLGSWASSLRAAVSRDAMRFEEYYENPKAKSFMDKRGRDPWHCTNRVLENIFADISEVSCYQVDERDDKKEEFLQAIYESWERAKKYNFKRKISGEKEHNW